MTDTLESPAPLEDESAEPDEAESLNELLLQFGGAVSALVFCEAQLAASRNMHEVRRAARDVAAALVAGLAFLTGFAFLSVAGVLALSTVLDPWLAALVLAAAWIVVGAALSVALLVRAGRATGWRWWRVFSAGPDEAAKDLQKARDDAEEAVHESLTRLAPVLALEIATAAVSMAGDMAEDVAEGVIDAGEDILDATEDFVEDIVEDLPGGGLVSQVWDVALMPGRFGLRVATTVLGRGEPVEADADHTDHAAD